jgi:hypothetical protein
MVGIFVNGFSRGHNPYTWLIGDPELGQFGPFSIADEMAGASTRHCLNGFEPRSDYFRSLKRQIHFAAGNS